MSELQPCPFCGNDAEIVTDHHYVQVECTECALPYGETELREEGAHQNARDEWNRRACPPWVRRAMERIHDMVAPSVLSGEYGRVIVKVFMDEAAQDGVEIG